MKMNAGVLARTRHTTIVKWSWPASAYRRYAEREEIDKRQQKNKTKNKKCRRRHRDVRATRVGAQATSLALRGLVSASCRIILQPALWVPILHRLVDNSSSSTRDPSTGRPLANLGHRNTLRAIGAAKGPSPNLKLGWWRVSRTAKEHRGTAANGRKKCKEIKKNAMQKVHCDIMQPASRQVFQCTMLSSVCNNIVHEE